MYFNKKYYCEINITKNLTNTMIMYLVKVVHEVMYRFVKVVHRIVKVVMKLCIG